MTPGKAPRGLPATYGKALGAPQGGLQGALVHDRLVGKRVRLVGPAGAEPAFRGDLVGEREVAVDAAGLVQPDVVGHLREHPLEVGVLVPDGLGGYLLFNKSMASLAEPYPGDEG